MAKEYRRLKASSIKPEIETSVRFKGVAVVGQLIIRVIAFWQPFLRKKT
jgi:hypothetical protein